ncbi:MAG: acetylornithine/succinylornithine family transaminase [Ruminococcaceae bacterium]|nr:acetylornithine/succinylornithine family transaminase [Oscillospiraceae bacterium]
MSNIKNTDKQYVANTYGRFDLVLTHGEGSAVYDENGKKYIDLATGIAVNTFGYSDAGWVAAVTEQLGKLQHTSNLYYHEPGARLAEKLCTRTGAKSVFFSNSGAEANECAIKTARLWAARAKGSDYYHIITLKNSFHGRTITTLAATGQDSFHTDFTPLTEGFLYAEANNIASVEELLKSHRCAAVLAEPVQGEGGVMPLTEEFMVGLRALCDKYNVLMMLDEVQTGNGRSGHLYAYQHYGITPDVMSTAKGLAGGLPIGATLFFEKSHGTLTAGLHGSTFGANPISCAAACHVLDRIDEDLLAEVKAKSEYIFTTLTGKPGIKSVSGLGLMIGIETEGDSAKILAACMERGILPIKAKAKIRLLPALNIGWDDLRAAMEILAEEAEKASKA